MRKKKLSLFLIIVFLVFVSTLTFNVVPVFASGITFVQGNFKGTTTSNSITLTLNSIPANTNLLIVTFSSMTYGAGYASISSVVESSANWTQNGFGKQKLAQFYRNIGSGQYFDVEIWVGYVNGTNVSKTITVNMNASCSDYGAVADVCEFSGLKTTNFLDQTAINNTGGASTPCYTGTTSVSTSANELFIGSIAIYDTTFTMTNPQNSFTLLDGVGQNPVGNGGILNCFLYYVASSMNNASSGVTDTLEADYNIGCIITIFASSVQYSVSSSFSSSETFSEAVKSNFHFSSSISSSETFAENVHSVFHVPSSLSSSETFIKNIHSDFHIPSNFNNNNQFYFIYSQIIAPLANLTLNLDGIFLMLILMFVICLVLCLIRIPLAGFIVSLSAISMGAYAMTDSNMPFYPNPIIQVLVIVIGAVCFYLNVDRFKELGKKRRK